MTTVPLTLTLDNNFKMTQILETNDISKAIDIVNEYTADFTGPTQMYPVTNGNGFLKVCDRNSWRTFYVTGHMTDLTGINTEIKCPISRQIVKAD